MEFRNCAMFSAHPAAMTAVVARSFSIRPSKVSTASRPTPGAGGPSLERPYWRAPRRRCTRCWPLSSAAVARRQQMGCSRAPSALVPGSRQRTGQRPVWTRPSSASPHRIPRRAETEAIQPTQPTAFFVGQGRLADAARRPRTLVGNSPTTAEVPNRRYGPQPRFCQVQMQASLPSGSASTQNAGARASLTRRPPAARAAAIRASASSWATVTSR